MPEDGTFERVIARIGLANSCDDVLDGLCAGLRGVVPFNRVAVGLLDDAGDMLRLSALCSDGQPALKLGYSDPIAGSTLADLLRANRPRIINDLRGYLANKPSSRSTRLMVREGMRANLSLPLIVRGKPFGFVFFSSRESGAYSSGHATLLARLSPHLGAALTTARRIESLEKQLQALTPRAPLPQPSAGLNALRSLPGLQGICRAIEQVANTDATVLISGETGTGKELVARALHEYSSRCRGPLVTVHCAAYPRDLLPGELFGHEAGAFTGAVGGRAGCFERADGGTLFLDEIGEISLEAQVALLRVLQERIVERLGGTGPVAVDIRLLAASNRDLRTAVDSGQFRADLFHRLNVFPIHIPPLRERRDDVSILADAFLQRFAQRFQKPVRTIPGDVLERMAAYHWPGNVRELENVIERAVIVSAEPELRVDASWLVWKPAASSSSWADQERDIIRAALLRSGGRVYGPAGAAALLGLKPTTLYGKMRKLGLRRGDVR